MAFEQFTAKLERDGVKVASSPRSILIQPLGQLARERDKALAENEKLRDALQTLKAEFDKAVEDGSIILTNYSNFSKI